MSARRSSGPLRTRWGAIGAAIAVSFGAGGVGIGSATTTSGEMPIYVPIEPCRLADTRPAFQVGPRTAPLGPGETYRLSGWGSVGDCTLPNGTTGLSLNVTATNQTLPTFLTLFPATSTLPTASHLNPTPGQPPIPNAVNVDLDAAGEFNVYNLQGLVDVIVDVVGYYDHHSHDDRYYTRTAIDAALADKADTTDVYTQTDADAAFLSQGEIVISHGTSNLSNHGEGGDPATTVLHFASGTEVSGDGQVTLGLIGPAVIGGLDYRLTAIEYCIDVPDVAPATLGIVWIESQTPASIVENFASADVDGCYTVDASSLPRARGYGVEFLVGGGADTSLRIVGVRSTWSP